MTISKLAKTQVWSPNCSSRGGQKICKFTPHYMAGNLTVKQCGEVFVPKSREASSNYGIDSDGNIACYVDEESRAWTSSSASNDSRAITVEVANTSNVTGQVTKKAWDALVRLATDICYRYKFRLKWTGDENGSLTAHYMFSSTACPGPYLKAHMGDLVKAVNSNLDSGNVSFCGSKDVKSDYSGGGLPSDGLTSNPASSYAAAIDAKVVFEREDINPFVVTLDQNSSKADYAKLRAKGVVGAMIDMGQLYTDKHAIRPTFRQPKLDEQVEAAEKAGIQFGLYTTSYARDAAEADAEMLKVQLEVKRHPPRLGMWVRPNFTKKRSVNEEIMKVFQERLQECGLSGQIGLYCAAKPLKSIRWEDWCMSWHWWMVRHVESVDGLEDKTAVPSYFAFEDPTDELLEPGEYTFDDSGDPGDSGDVGNGDASYKGKAQALRDANAAQKKIVKAANDITFSQGGYCMMYVSKVYERAGLGYPYGDACDNYRKWCKSSSKDDLKVGMIVAVSTHTNGGSAGVQYGHVGIYVGDGKVRHNVGSVQTISLDSWIKTYGTTVPVKWGFATTKTVVKASESKATTKLTKTKTAKTSTSTSKTATSNKKSNVKLIDTSGPKFA